MEEWRPISSTNGMIEVSNNGKMRSLLRGAPYILKAQVDNKGYYRIRVTINRVKMSFKVHREVAKAFIPNPNHHPQVNHIDGNKSNNSASNLEWCTNKENAHHAINNGLWESVFIGAKRNSDSLRKPVIAYKLYGEEPCTRYYESVSQAERDFDSRHISDVLKGKRKHCKGYTFVYAEGGDAQCQY